MKLASKKAVDTAADLMKVVRRLGVPAHRVLVRPVPGTATEKDLLRSKRKGVELVDGVLVEKAMGWYESRLGCVLIFYLESYLSHNKLGFVLGEQGLMRVAPAQLRMPDVAFYAWDDFPGHILPDGQIMDVVPRLAVEILSPDNTKKEMERKRGEYFAGGAQLVWEVYPAKRQVAVFTAPDQCTVLDENGTLDAGSVLPGFSLSIREWFERAGHRA